MARRQKQKNTFHVNHRYFIPILVIVVIALIVFFKMFSRSLFFSPKDRINFVVYGQKTIYFSISNQSDGDYAIVFYPDLKVQVPGGYGYYRVGALGKLIALEKKPELLKKTFSLATDSFVDYYFYPKNDQVYFGKQNNDSGIPQVNINGLKSNASFFDRLYFWLLLSGKKMSGIKVITDLPVNEQNGDQLFSQTDFTKQYLSYFYQKSYRNDDKIVQLLYPSNYDVGLEISNVIQGNGIRVSDISLGSALLNQCVVREDVSKFSLTATTLASFFHCQLERGKTDIYDIIFEIGKSEGEWEVK